jgi:glutamate synthase (NADPH/NADH) large chain
VTDDDFVVMASEVGVLDIPEKKIVKKWRLQPGKMLLVDLEAGRIVDDDELKRTLATAKPYRAWIDRCRLSLEAMPEPAPAEESSVALLDRQQAFGWTLEDLKVILAPMAQAPRKRSARWATTPRCRCSRTRPKVFYNYFKQLFAQVTNPPIDPIREELVMSLVSFVGPRPNLLAVDVGAAAEPPMRLEVEQPILTAENMEKLRHIELFSGDAFHAEELDIGYPTSWGANGMEAALASLCAHAVDAIRKGTQHPDPVRPLGRRRPAADPGAARDRGRARAPGQDGAAHVAGPRRRDRLGARGAPLRAARRLRRRGDPSVPRARDARASSAELGEPDGKTAQKKFVKAICKGLYKVMSKMGISTYQSYCGAQIFEAVGLRKAFVDKYFTGTASNVEGIGLFEVAEEAARLHALAFGRDSAARRRLDAGGEYQYRVRGEEHMWTPDSIAKLQHATRANSFSTYKEYAALINDQGRKLKTLRGLFELRAGAQPPVPLDEVEPAKDIVRRFATGAMSLGSISTEAHTTLAVAMNRIGGKSNTGEGGEDPMRYRAELRAGRSAIEDGDTLAKVIGHDRVAHDFRSRRATACARASSRSRRDASA